MNKDLLINVQTKFGREILTQSDLNQLKDDIYFLTNHNIGFNTLRRFYGFLESVSPSRKTLTILSNYIGYRSYEAFLNRNVVDNLWEDISRVTNISQKESLNVEDIEWLKSCQKTSTYYLILVSLINQLLIDKKINMLKEVFNTKSIFDISRSEFSKLASLFMINKKNFSKKDLKYYLPLLTDKIYKELVLFIYVDYDRYNGQYGFLLNSSFPFLKSDDEKLFVNLFIDLCNYLNNEKTQIDYDKLKVPLRCHPILYGRYLAMSVFKNESNIDFNFLLKESKKQKDKLLFFQEVILIIMIMKKVDYLDTIFNLYYDELLGYKNWENIMIERYNILALAFVHLKRQELRRCEQTISFFDKEKQIHSNNKIQYIFYHIIMYHLSIQNGAKKQIINDSKFAYLRAVKETKFKLFNVNYLNTFFD